MIVAGIAVFGAVAAFFATTRKPDADKASSAASELARAKAKAGDPTRAEREPVQAREIDPAEAARQRWRQRAAEREAARQQNPNADSRSLFRAGGADSGGTIRDANGNPLAVTGANAVGPDGARINANGAGPVMNARLPGDANAQGATSPSRSPSGSGRSSSGSSSTAPRSIAAGGAQGPGCGDGIVQAGEQCEPASTPKCGDDCRTIVSDQCYDCELNSACVAIASSCVDLTTNELDQSLCYDVQHCIQDTGCAAGQNTLTSCFCGNLTLEECRSAPAVGDKAPNGACADVIRDAVGGSTASNALVLTRFTSNTNPAGIAIKRFQCLKNDATCAPICFK
jgi:hypothetical protein